MEQSRIYLDRSMCAPRSKQHASEFMSATKSTALPFSLHTECGQETASILCKDVPKIQNLGAHSSVLCCYFDLGIAN